MAEQVSIKDFLRKRQMATKEVKFKGFPAPFVIQEITNEENEKLQKSVTKITKTRSGQITQNMDQDKYAKELNCILLFLESFVGLTLDKANKLQ